MSKPKFLGSFDAGMRFVDLYASAGVDARFSMQPEDGKNARIEVGIDNVWWKVLSNMVHEIMELTYTDMGLRMIPAPDIAEDNGAYFFSMNHTQFSEATARVALFLSEAAPTLQKYRKKYGKK